jgi:biotin synthase
VDPEPVQEAAEEANKNSVTAVGLVAAWKGLNEGPLLDEVCDRVRELKAGGKTRPDVSLGIIKSQRVADRLKEAGVECYGHNLESSRRFFPKTCTTHTYDDRLETIGYLKKAGLKICSGGIIGMGETREDRCDLAFALKEIGANVVPINILNPIPGTPFEKNEPLPVLEILKTIACFRFILPRQEIMIAGGRTVNLRDAQSMIFMAGASALMVGNYLTTLNQPVEKDLQMLKDLGLDPSWDKHGFSDQEEIPVHRAGGQIGKGTEAVAV